jgi:phosphatidylglycerophosphatase A
VGSLLGVSLFVGFLESVPLSLSMSTLILVYALGVLGLFGLGVWASGKAELDFGQHDDGRIVIDEVLGQLIALAPIVVLIPPIPVHVGTELVARDYFSLFPWVVTGFVLFRLFDMWKPGAVSWAERRFDGGMGVMADDAVAGMYAAFALFLMASFFTSHSLLGPQAFGLASHTFLGPQALSVSEALVVGSGSLVDSGVLSGVIELGVRL